MPLTRNDCPVDAAVLTIGSKSICWRPARASASCFRGEVTKPRAHHQSVADGARAMATMADGNAKLVATMTATIMVSAAARG